MVAAPADDGNLRIKAFVSTRNGQKLSVISLKQFCSEQVPLYMVPDAFQGLEALPMTSTGKIDYQQLKQL